MGPKVIFAMAIAMAIWFMAISGAASAAEPEIIYIAEGGHYAVGPLSFWGTAEVWVNMTVLEGGPVDVYLMTMTQYENSYLADPDVPIAFSCKNSSVENVTSAGIHFTQEAPGQYSYGYFDPLFIVVDNRNCNLTSGDAVPTGPVTVRLEVDYYEEYYDFYDHGLDDFPFLLCTIAPLITIIIIVALLYLAMKRGDSGARPPPLPPYPMPPAENPAGPIPPPGPPEK